MKGGGGGERWGGRGKGRGGIWVGRRVGREGGGRGGGSGGESKGKEKIIEGNAKRRMNIGESGSIPPEFKRLG